MNAANLRLNFPFTGWNIATLSRALDEDLPSPPSPWSHLSSRFPDFSAQVQILAQESNIGLNTVLSYPRFHSQRLRLV